MLEVSKRFKNVQKDLRRSGKVQEGSLMLKKAQKGSTFFKKFQKRFGSIINSAISFYKVYKFKKA